MSQHPADYFTEIDLNPTINGAAAPVAAFNDRRAMHYFGFGSHGQQLQLLDGLPQGTRVLFSFGYANQPGVGPIANDVQAHGALDFFGGPPIARYENSHDRAHVLVWLDGPPPPMGQQCRVRVTAWRKD